MSGGMGSKGKNMSNVKRGLICIVTALTIACLIAGCNTLKGAGKDIEAGGKAIQNAAD